MCLWCNTEVGNNFKPIIVLENTMIEPIKTDFKSSYPNKIPTIKPNIKKINELDNVTMIASLNIFNNC